MSVFTDIKVRKNYEKGNVSMSRDKFNYEIRQIDAWNEGDNYWTWNESFHICNFSSSANNISRAFMRKIHALGIAFSVPVKVVFDGDIWEVQRRDNDMPIFALIPIDY